MDPITQLSTQIETLEKKIDTLVKTVHLIKQFILWMLVATIVAFIVPLLGLILIIPQFLSIYSAALNF